MLKISVKNYVDENFKNINQFAKAIGISHNSAQSIYDGTVTRIEFSTLEMMCKIFNCTPNNIFVTIPTQTKYDISSFPAVEVKTSTYEELPQYFKAAIRKMIKEELNDTKK